MSPPQDWGAELAARQAELRRFARRLAADPHLADDLLQELNLVALGARGQPATVSLVWMKGVLRHLFRNELRRSARRRDHERHAAAALEPGEGAERAAQLAQILSALTRLPEPYRATLTARFLEGRTPVEIARASGLPLRTVHTRTTRGLARLRRALGQLERDRRALFAGGLAAGLLTAGLAGAWFVPGASSASRAPLRHECGLTAPSELEWVLVEDLPSCVRLAENERGVGRGLALVAATR